MLPKLGRCCGPVLPHAGALSHRLEALEHGDLLRAVRTLLPLGKRRNQPDGRAARLIGDRAQRRREEQREVEEDGEREHIILLVVCVPLLCREKRATHGKATVQKGDAEVIELAPHTATHASLFFLMTSLELAVHLAPLSAARSAAAVARRAK